MDDKELLKETHATVMDIKQYLAANSVRIETAERRLDSHSKDLKDLEAYKNKALGIVALLGLFFGVVGAFISKMIGGH